MKKYDVAVIGGCAAGIAAAINAKRRNPKLNIAIIEKLPKLGKKILATGNGRCNLTNLNAKCSDYKNPKFVWRALEAYSPDDVIAFFESMGLLTYSDSEGRVYPRSNVAASVLDALRFEVEALGIDVICDTPVETVKKSGGEFVVNGNIVCRKLLVATGGKASPSQGSDGSGYALAESLGHTVTKLYPSLVPLTVSGNVKPLKGVRARNVVLTLTNGKTVKKTSGELLFTENGISGIAAMELASKAGELLDDVKSKAFTRIDFLPDMNEEELISYLKNIKNIKMNCTADILFTGVLPWAIGVEVCKAAKLYKQDKTISSFSNGDIIKLAQTAKNYVLEVSGTKGFTNAQVTSGGVSVNEINSETMESKLCKGLFFAGEIIDVDAGCGGYNLQWAFASGLLAGENIW